MGQSLLIDNPDFFSHISLLKEASESWILRGEQTKAGIIFMSIIKSKREIHVCDRTKKDLSTSAHSIAFIPAILELIKEKSTTNCENMENDEYSLKVASLMKTFARPLYYVVADSQRENIKQLATEKGYNLKIVSPSDFSDEHSLILN